MIYHFLKNCLVARILPSSKIFCQHALILSGDCFASVKNETHSVVLIVIQDDLMAITPKRVDVSEPFSRIVLVTH